ncbi:hypothetical protein EVAR_3160_1 [Eumeta japonica]|uniref:Nucleic-acid-binding protein from transposon X-element n=1 Tax=Eumeta variegata TaxID=151549 RepID=A0A4C1XGA9_EUMVA|nr:hypothetical protein EVAR_3160_1 [Eumeta japonica]
MIHTYLFIYSFNIAVAVAVVSFGAVSQEYGSSPALLLLPLLPLRGLRPTARLSECCRSLSLALGIRSIRVKTEFREIENFFSSSISLAADRPAGLEPPPYPRIAPHSPPRAVSADQNLEVRVKCSFIMAATAPVRLRLGYHRVSSKNTPNSEYPVQAVHRMHRRDGTALGLVLAILNKTDGATDIFKKLANVCGLSGITVEAPYKKEGKPACCNCGSDHTANYGGCPAAPKPKPKSSYNKNSTKVHQTSRPLDVSHFPALNSGNKQTARTVPTKPTGSKTSTPPRPEGWRTNGRILFHGKSKTTGTENRVPQNNPHDRPEPRLPH